MSSRWHSFTGYIILNVILLLCLLFCFGPGDILPFLPDFFRPPLQSDAISGWLRIFFFILIALCVSNIVFFARLGKKLSDMEASLDQRIAENRQELDEQKPLFQDKSSDN